MLMQQREIDVCRKLVGDVAAKVVPPTPTVPKTVEISRAGKGIFDQHEFGILCQLPSEAFNNPAHIALVIMNEDGNCKNEVEQSIRENSLNLGTDAQPLVEISRKALRWSMPQRCDHVVRNIEAVVVNATQARREMCDTAVSATEIEQSHGTAQLLSAPS